MSSLEEIAQLRQQAAAELPAHLLPTYLKFLDGIAATLTAPAKAESRFIANLIKAGAVNARPRRRGSLYVSSPSSSKKSQSPPRHTRKSSGSSHRKTRSGNR